MGVNVVEAKEAELEKDLATREETEEEAEGENELVEVQQRLVPAESGGEGPAPAHQRPSAHVSPRNELSRTPFARE